MNRTASAPSAGLFLAAILVAGVALRIPHLQGPLDEPHAWRQAETAQCARAFWTGGTDLLRPSVCWLGTHRTLAFEFPLPEAAMALGYRALGHESLLLARLVSLACYLGAAAYLFRLVALLFGTASGCYAALMFLVLPLGLYYSRAIHVDPAALLCTHAALYYAVRGYEAGGIGHMIAASLWATLAFLIKAPYAFYCVLPMAALLATQFRPARAIGLAAAAVPALAAFFWWRHHAMLVNAAVPDWSFIPGFKSDLARHVGVDTAWIYGTLAQRLDPTTWLTLARRLWHEVAGPVGCMLVAIATALAPATARRFGSRPTLFLWCWGAGLATYLLVFTNLNVVHDYYQLPLLAGVAAFAGVGIETFRREWADVVPWVSSLAVAVALTLLATHSLVLSHRFYQLDPPRAEAASLIAASTPSDARVIGASTRSTHTDDPRLLYRAGRVGWSVAVPDLDSTLAQRLATIGATHAAVLLDADTLAATAELARAFPTRTFTLAARPWRLLLMDLRAGRDR